MRAPATSLLTPVEQLIEAGVFAERADRLSFRHDTIREAVRGSTTVSARRALDRQAVDVLLAAGAIPVEVASQLAASAEPGDEVAVGLLKDAADALGLCDPAAAAELGRRRIELGCKTCLEDSGDQARLRRLRHHWVVLAECWRH